MKHKKYERIFIYAFIVAFSLSFAGLAHCEDYSKFPSGPINYIVSLPPGSTGDLVARFIGKAAEKYLGQPIVVINKPGAGNTIGAAALAASKPDGYTVGYAAPSAMLIAPYMEKLPYRPLENFQFLLQFTEAPFAIVVKNDSPFKSFKDLIEFAKKNPGKVSYGTTGANSIVHLTMLQIIKKEKGIQFRHVAFKGGPETQAAILGGHVSFGASDFNFALLEAKEIRLLAMMADKRNPFYPDVPTLTELGYGLPDVPPAPIYHCIAVPKGVPDEIRVKLEKAFTQAMKEPVFLNGLKDIRFQPVYKNSKEFTEYMKYYYDFYGNVLKDMGLRKH